MEEATARLEALQGDYDFDFIVVRWPSEFPMPARALLYQNSHYAVLQARSADLPDVSSADGITRTAGVCRLQDPWPRGDQTLLGHHDHGIMKPSLPHH